ncbi:MAG TPA: hypothetical protein PK308_10145, partial [Phycisphaerales bacterium]|nr:hypothetical protein [Phycisphaerales bacterium]
DLVEGRADEYAGFAPGGETGLVVKSNIKIVGTGPETPPEIIPIYSYDKSVVDSVLDLQREQAAEEERLRRNRRADEKQAREIERHRFEMEAARDILDAERAADSPEAEECADVLNLPDNGRTRRTD